MCVCIYTSRVISIFSILGAAETIGGTYTLLNLSTTAAV